LGGANWHMVYFSGLDSGKKERNLKLSDPKHGVQVVLNEHSFAAEQSAVDEVCMCVCVRTHAYVYASTNRSGPFGMP
jgi:hypothetical protein